MLILFFLLTKISIKHPFTSQFLREELKYDSGYEKRQKAFHFNDDMHISVKELWEAWLRSEVCIFTTINQIVLTKSSPHRFTIGP